MAIVQRSIHAHEFSQPVRPGEGPFFALRSGVLSRHQGSQTLAVSLFLSTMEANGPQRDRSRPPSQHPRAPSRSSTNTSLNRMTPKSSNNSATNLVSPSLPANGAYPPPHRFHQSRSSLSGRVPPLSLSREPTDDLRPQNPPVLSSFLQEKLSRERKLESNRSSRRLSADLSASADLTMRATQSSPVRTNTGDGRRPRSSGGDAPAPKKKGGMGLKEMEQVCSVPNLTRLSIGLLTVVCSTRPSRPFTS